VIECLEAEREADSTLSDTAGEEAVVCLSAGCGTAAGAVQITRINHFLASPLKMISPLRLMTTVRMSSSLGPNALRVTA